MRRFVKWTLAAIILLGVVFVAGAYALPGDISIKRSIVIAAPPDMIFQMVGDLRHGKDFSPWAEIDPATQYTYEGPEIGVGQKASWHSQHPEVGSGSMTVTEYIKDRHMAAALDLGEMGKGTMFFDVLPAGNGANVVWGFKAALQNPLERWMCAVLDIDSLIGKDYEKGLAKLKSLMEQVPAPPS
jgi:hypothetical protein